MQGLREENAPVDCHAAEIDADALHQAGEAYVHPKFNSPMHEMDIFNIIVFRINLDAVN